MPAINPAILKGTKLFKAELAIRRLTSKVNRLNSELASAKDAKVAAERKLQGLKFRADADDVKVAATIKDAYFAD